MAIAFGLTLLAFQGFAQHKGEFWAGYILSADIGSRWALWQDSHFLTRSFIIGRTGISYRIKPHSTLTAGYAYLQTAASFSTSLVRPEHRPWAQIDSRWKINGNTRYSLRFRYDARFRQSIDGNELASGYIFYNRFRIMNRLHSDIGIWKNYRLSVNFLSEVLFNAGKQLPSNRIDQFRTFVMFGVQPKPKYPATRPTLALFAACCSKQPASIRCNYLVFS